MWSASGGVGLSVLGSAGHQAPLTPWPTWGEQTVERGPEVKEAPRDTPSAAQAHETGLDGTCLGSRHLSDVRGTFVVAAGRLGAEPSGCSPRNTLRSSSFSAPKEHLRSAPPLGWTPGSSKASARIGCGRTEIFVPGVYQLCTAIILPGDSLAVRQAFILSRNLQRHL